MISRDRIAIAAACVALPLVASAHPAVGIVVDRTGTVFYSDTAHVWTVRPDGTKTIVVRDVHTHELWLDADGVLYGEHLWYEGVRLICYLCPRPRRAVPRDAGGTACGSGRPTAP